MRRSLPRLPDARHLRAVVVCLALVLGLGMLAPSAARGAEVLGTAITVDGATPARAKVGERIAVTGEVRRRLLGGGIGGPDAGRKVVLQVWSDTGWRTVSTTHASLSGRFRLPAPTYYVGRHRFRVQAAATLLRKAADSAARTIAVSLPYRPAGRASSWSRLAQPGVRWNPCRTIPFYVNPVGAPRGARALVTRALREITRASGLRFRYAGHTRLVPWRTGLSPQHTFPAYGIAVAWSTGRTVRAISGSPLGYGGPWLETTYSPSGQLRTTAVAGGVVIDRDYRLAPRFGTGRTLGWVLIHELGHVVGLDHSNDTKQVMHGTLRDSSSTRLGAGDLTGFRQLGADRGCL